MYVSSEIAPSAVITSDTFVAYATSFGSRVALDSSSYRQDGNEYASRFLGIRIAYIDCSRAKKPGEKTLRVMLVGQLG